MNLRDLQYLIALSEHQHFGRAAEACHVSQPTLSTQIKKLEDELGVALVERDNKKVLTTEVGRRVVEHARDVLSSVEAIKTVAHQARDPESGSLRLGLIPTIAPYLLPYAVKAIRQHFPELTLYLHEAQTHVLVEMLKSGKLDAAIMALPINDERLECYPLYSEAFFAALPMGHPLEHAPVLRPEQLEDEAIMLLEDGHCLRDQALAVCQQMGSQEMQSFRATSLETLRQMVASGTGVTLLPTLAAETSQNQDSDIRIIPFTDPQPKRNIGMVYRPSSPRKALFQAVGQAVAQRLPKGLKNHLEIIYEQ
ncbi:MAG: DNA-binding transcriptional regulator OxyR [Gammaproteobacteria bacterium]|nr:MAG: DNA-binding transcriptional regulator OxyR [Gammaproteobacteria bacterium]